MKANNADISEESQLDLATGVLKQTAQRELATGVLKLAAQDLRRFRGATSRSSENFTSMLTAGSPSMNALRRFHS